MNANRKTFDVKIEKFQLQETLSSLIHQIIWLRSNRKRQYDGNAWFVDVNCDTIDLTYIRTNCDRLDKRIQDELARFAQFMNSDKSIKSGSFSLEFYKKQLNIWGYPVAAAAWEVWTFNVKVVDHRNSTDKRQKLREDIGEILSHYILEIMDFVNNGTAYLPNTQTESSLLYDLTFDNAQPYNFRFTSSEPNNPYSLSNITNYCMELAKSF